VENHLQQLRLLLRRKHSVTNSEGSKGHLLDPYLTMFRDYGWANFIYQTNQGASYSAHQFLFAGTSAMTAYNPGPRRTQNKIADRLIATRHRN
jgi:hypothetical protein